MKWLNRGEGVDYTNKSKGKKKRKRIIVCSVIGIIIIGIAAGALALYNWQKNNIAALRYAAGYSADEIADQIENTDKQIQERISEVAGTFMRPLTEEESQLLANGEITQDEAVALITGKTTLEEIQSGEYIPKEEQGTSDDGGGEYGKMPPTSGAAPNTTQSKDVSAEGHNTASENGGGGSQDIGSTLAKIYALEGEFSASIDSLISQAMDDYKNSVSVSELIGTYSGLASSMEGECDSRMESLLGELEAKLDASGGDKSVIGEIRAAYDNKKSLKKAELMSRYGN